VNKGSELNGLIAFSAECGSSGQPWLSSARTLAESSRIPLVFVAPVAAEPRSAQQRRAATSPASFTPS